jgi:uncharacterized protein (DUF1330 family)
MTLITAGAIDPSRVQFDQFKALPRDQPVHMLNLVRLRAMAEYSQGHPDKDKALTGLEAYRAYGLESAPIFKRVGGLQIWAGRPDLVLTGPEGEAWELAFIAAYPSGGAFLEMVTDPLYRIVVQHRTAGVLDSRLIRMAPLEPGEGFGE